MVVKFLAVESCLLEYRGICFASCHGKRCSTAKVVLKKSNNNMTVSDRKPIGDLNVVRGQHFTYFI